jgi:flagellar biosynthesis regulator FlaF
LSRSRHRGLSSARGILLAARDRIQREPEIGKLHRAKDTGPEASLLIKVINLSEHKLRKVIRDAPKNEKQLQDEFEKLFIGADIFYSREATHIEYSSKTYCARLHDRASTAGD